MLTLADKGGRGGLENADIVLQRGRGSFGPIILVDIISE